MSMSLPSVTAVRIFWERDVGLPEVIKKSWAAFGVMDNLGKVSEALRNTMSSQGSEVIKKWQHHERD